MIWKEKGGKETWLVEAEDGGGFWAQDSSVSIFTASTELLGTNLRTGSKSDKASNKLLFSPKRYLEEPGGVINSPGFVHLQLLLVLILIFSFPSTLLLFLFSLSFPINGFLEPFLLVSLAGFEDDFRFLFWGFGEIGEWAEQGAETDLGPVRRESLIMGLYLKRRLKMITLREYSCCIGY